MSEHAGIERRTAMKMAVGAATAGVVWSAPKVEGLSLRPNYAAAASNVSVPFRTGVSPSLVTNITALSILDCVNAATIEHFLDNWGLIVSGDGLSNCSVTIDAVSPGTSFPSNNTVTSNMIAVFGGAQSITGVVLNGTFTCA